MRIRRFVLAFLTAAGLLAASAAPALAELLVIPIRVSFAPRERAQAITLINTSDKTNTYRLEWKYFRLLKEGGMAEVPPDQWTQSPRLGDMIKIAPRQVVIPPQGKQVVRLSLRRPADLAAGEYRGYLSITRLADADALKKAAEQKGTGIVLGVNLNLNIPVVVRQGEGQAAAKIGAVAFVPPSHHTAGRPALRVEILGQNTVFSPYGKINVFWTNPAGEEKLIGFVENAYIYPEIASRPYTIPLNVAAVEGGSLRVDYQGIKEYEGQMFDRKIVPVGR